ncbi:aldo/keto reductase [Streptomyces sp. NPDC056730]|uniref:aldo/keto reductase n=1 Tax=unclassified Streptomyces TaxID=2593676 RepID=UPI003693DA42
MAVLRRPVERGGRSSTRRTLTGPVSRRNRWPRRRIRIRPYQPHRPAPGVPLAEQPGALAEPRQEGKIRYIGLDTIAADQLERALSLTGIASVQNRFPLLDRTSAAVSRLCEDRGLALLPWFPLSNGALTGAAATALGSVAAAPWSGPRADRPGLAAAPLPRAVPHPRHRLTRPPGRESGRRGGPAVRRGHERAETLAAAVPPDVPALPARPDTPAPPDPPDPPDTPAPPDPPATD